jgi:uncharacterized protein YegP (UPF0339 family)
VKTKYKFVIKQQGNGEWNWTLVGRNGKVLATANQGYAKRGGAVKQAEGIADDLIVGCNADERVLVVDEFGGIISEYV